MELSVREVATLLGLSRRTVRARLVRGDLQGRKRDGEWRVERRQLPMTEAQRHELQGKAQRIRDVVEDALPSRMARSRGQRLRSIADLDAFRRGAEVLSELSLASGETLAEAARDQAAKEGREALLAFAEGVQLFDRGLKLEALNRARAGLARCVGRLLLEAGIPPAEPVFGWVSAIESEVLPAVAGFARWADQKRGSRG